jgi:hypothetical protein
MSDTTKQIKDELVLIDLRLASRNVELLELFEQLAAIAAMRRKIKQARAK